MQQLYKEAKLAGCDISVQTISSNSEHYDLNLAQKRPYGQEGTLATNLRTTK
jgi:hypothetical protein